MPFPLDMPDCTSSAQDRDVLQLPAASDASGTRSSGPAWFSVVKNAALRISPYRYFRYGVLPVSIVGALLTGSVLPSARPTAVTPSVAAYATTGVIGGLVGDFPVADEAALEDGDEFDGLLSFGAPVAEPAAAPIVGTTTDESVNLRSGPSTKHDVIAKLSNGTTLEVIGQQSGWYRVATARGTVGWVMGDFFNVAAVPAAPPARGVSSTVTATISEGRVNVRKGPDTRHASYGKMAEGTNVEVLARSGDWYQVRSPRGTIGWVTSSLLTLSGNATRGVPVTNDVPAVPTVTENTTAAGAAPARQVVAAPAVVSSSDAGRLAQRYVGSRYVWGGSSPRGFDCSGLVQYVYRQLGVRLPRKASAQYAQTRGQRIGSLGSLAPGDLVFFVRTTSARGITHVGLYIGNGMMVTANSPCTGVQRVSVYGKYWRSRFAGGVRPAR